MIFASYAYRVVSNFMFLGLVYFTLNLLEKYEQRDGRDPDRGLCGDARLFRPALVLFLPAHRAPGG
ncbi:hypothetical protein AB7M47_005264 [Bradyrhizobium elkanii]|jgi:hypothetical protein|nr:hypothetical protein [Bradyrhizobium elkanii]MCS3558668.1 hypothetical protein [Bradyrhizobium elkanii]MCW2151485.1 hypothetical protein [Bradyrhizobium elkanii]MCW2358642.1 hypothetical protein [Bradyrhizobium elkanii]MCW2375216.1 hypothetical protein [Bradyrhizobium elkanii]